MHSERELGPGSACMCDPGARPVASAGDERLVPIGLKMPSSEVPRPSVASKTTSRSTSSVSGCTATTKTYVAARARRPSTGVCSACAAHVRSMCDACACVSSASASTGPLSDILGAGIKVTASNGFELDLSGFLVCIVLSALVMHFLLFCMVFIRHHVMLYRNSVSIAQN